MGACTDAAVAAMTEGERPALYHLAVDAQTEGVLRRGVSSRRRGRGLALVVQDVDVVIDLSADEVMMKLRAIDCHKSQLEDWRIAVREQPRLLEKGYGHEPYITVSSRATGLTAAGLLGEFA